MLSDDTIELWNSILGEEIDYYTFNHYFTVWNEDNEDGTYSSKVKFVMKSGKENYISMDYCSFGSNGAQPKTIYEMFADTDKE